MSYSATVVMVAYQASRTVVIGVAVAMARGTWVVIVAMGPSSVVKRGRCGSVGGASAEVATALLAFGLVKLLEVAELEPAVLPSMLVVAMVLALVVKGLLHRRDEVQAGGTQPHVAAILTPGIVVACSKTAVPGVRFAVGSVLSGGWGTWPDVVGKVAVGDVLDAGGAGSGKPALIVIGLVRSSPRGVGTEGTSVRIGGK